MRWFCAGIIGLASVAAISLPSAPAHADQYKWCAVYGGFHGDAGKNCGFVTYQQCLATVSGIGGHCEPNPFYGPEKRKHRR
jgi:hypothetical protein